MSKVYITGDTHLPIDIGKLNSDNFPEGNSLTKDDYVIIAGDFGLLWNYKKTGFSVDSNPEDLCWSPEEIYWKTWLEDKPWTTLFIDGNHENHARLDSYPISDWHGGKVQFISPSIIHLMRGQIFDIGGYSIFTFGGGKSIDRGAAVGAEERDQGKIWWSREIPSKEEFDAGLEVLRNHGNKVDLVVTHSLPGIALNNMRIFGGGPLTVYFGDLLASGLEFQHWYSGHYHKDRTDGKFTVVFNEIKEIEL